MLPLPFFFALIPYGIDSTKLRKHSSEIVDGKILGKQLLLKYSDQQQRAAFKVSEIIFLPHSDARFEFQHVIVTMCTGLNA